MAVVGERNFDQFVLGENNGGLQEQKSVHIFKTMDGMTYRTLYGAHAIYRSNKDDSLAKTHLETKLAELKKVYPEKNGSFFSADSQFWSANNARRIAIQNIEKELEDSDNKEVQSNLSSDHSKLSLAYLNLARIFWVFVRFDLNEMVALFDTLKICMPAISEAQLMAYLDVANETLWFLSVALFGLRLVIDLALAAKHIFFPDGAEARLTHWQRAKLEYFKRWSDCLNYITWGMVNAMSNFPQWFGIPLVACFPIVAGVLLFDVWIAYRKHLEERRKIKAAIQLVEKDINTTIAILKGKYKTDQLSFDNMANLEQLAIREEDAEKQEALKTLFMYYQEKQALENRRAMQSSVYHWRQKSALVVCAAFSLSVLATLAATISAFPPLWIPVLALTLALLAWDLVKNYSEQKERGQALPLNQYLLEYAKKHKTALGLSAAFITTFLLTAAFFPPATVLLCYFAVSLGIAGYYKEADCPFKKLDTCSYSTYKELRLLQKEAEDKVNNGDESYTEVAERYKALAEKTRFRLCVDMAAVAILPPVLIGSLAVCWPLTIAAGALLVCYVAYALYRKFYDPCKKQEDAKAIEGQRYTLFSSNQDDTDPHKEQNSSTATGDLSLPSCDYVSDSELSPIPT